MKANFRLRTIVRTSTRNPERSDAMKRKFTLEIGCGLHREHGVDVAIDISRNASCDVISNAHEIAFKDCIFDKVVAYEVLEHLSSPARALREVNRILKDDGTFRFSIPNIMYYRTVLRWILKSKIAVSGEHINGWTLAEIENLLTTTGFRITKINFTDRPWFNKPSLFSSCLPRITKHSLLINAAKMSSQQPIDRSKMPQNNASGESTRAISS